MPGTAVVVTDSTASLPPEVAGSRGIVVVPLQVVIGATVYDEGPGGATPEMVAEALKEFRPVSTSRPAPAYLAEVYAKAAADGADEILSVHLSGGDERHATSPPCSPRASRRCPSPWSTRVRWASRPDMRR